MSCLCVLSLFSDLFLCWLSCFIHSPFSLSVDGHNPIPFSFCLLCHRSMMLVCILPWAECFVLTHNFVPVALSLFCLLCNDHLSSLCWFSQLSFCDRRPTLTTRTSSASLNNS